MTDRSLRLAAAAAVAALALGAAGAPPAGAADNVPGKHYENKLVGFRFRPMNEWSVVPQGTDPNDPKLCGYYCDKAKFDRTVAKPGCSVYAFKVERVAIATDDTGLGGDEKPADAPKGPPKPPTEDEMREAFMASMRSKSTREKYDAMRREFLENSERGLQRIDEKKRAKMLKDIKTGEPVEKVLKNGDLEITTLECEVPLVLSNGRDVFVVEWRLYAGFARNDEYEIGVIYEIPGEEWKSYAQGIQSSVRSIEFMSGEEVADARADLADALAGKTDDERWLEEIKRKVSPGWDHLQTKNYLLVYNKEVKPDRVRAIAKQIELIRKDVYEVLFPPDRPVTAISVVRICKDKEQYTQYGGSPSSAGYWNWVEKELVFYEDTSAKADSLRVLNHEAFHQFIFYSVGSISPHDWFNEGHGDYFSGHNFSKSGKFVPAPFRWRTDGPASIKTAISMKKYIPLKTFVEYSHEQYYGPQIGQNYSQGWSLIWFLRQGRNPEWKDILPNYFNTLKTEVSKWVDEQVAEKKKEGTWTEGWNPGKTPHDVEEAARDKALKAAFGSFDDRKWDRFEKEWKDFKF